MRHLILMAFAVAPVETFADSAEIEAVSVSKSGGAYSFSVTVRHPDSGWDHYADGWEVLAPDGTKLGFRELLHPHEAEQPFTRTLGNITIPDGVTQVLIRARCSVDGWNDGSFPVDLPR